MPRVSSKNPNSQKQIYTGDLFNGGINTTKHPTILPLNEFVLLKNVDISGNVLKKRNGWKKITQGWRSFEGEKDKEIISINKDFYFFDDYIWYKNNKIYKVKYNNPNTESFIKFSLKKWEINTINNKIPLITFSYRDRMVKGSYLRDSLNKNTNQKYYETGNSFFFDLKEQIIKNYSDSIRHPYNLINSLGFNLLNKYNSGQEYNLNDDWNYNNWYRINYIIDNFRRAIKTDIKNFLPFNEEIYTIKIPELNSVCFFTLKNKQLPFFTLDNTIIPKYFDIYNTSLNNGLFNSVWDQNRDPIENKLVKINNKNIQDNNKWDAKIIYKAIFDKELQTELKAYESKTGDSKYTIKENIFNSKRSLFPVEYNSLFYLPENIISSFSEQDSLEIRKKTLKPYFPVNSYTYLQKIIDIDQEYESGTYNGNVIPNTFFTNEKIQRGFAFFGDVVLANPVNYNIYYNRIMNLSDKDYFSVEFIDIEYTKDDGTVEKIRIDKYNELYNKIAFDVELIGNNNISYTDNVNDTNLVGAPAYIPYSNTADKTNLGIKERNIKQWYLAKYLKYLSSKSKYIESVDENNFYMNNENLMDENFNTYKNFWLGTRLSEKMYIYKESYLNAYGNLPLRKNISKLKKAYSNIVYKSGFDNSKVILDASSENGLKIIPYFIEDFKIQTIKEEKKGTELNDYIELNNDLLIKVVFLDKYRVFNRKLSDSFMIPFIFKGGENYLLDYDEKDKEGLIKYILGSSLRNLIIRNKNTDKLEVFKIDSYDVSNISSINTENKNFYIKVRYFGLKFKNMNISVSEIYKNYDYSNCYISIKKDSIIYPLIRDEKNINNNIKLSFDKIIKNVVFKSAMVCFNDKQIDRKLNISVTKPEEQNFIKGLDTYTSKLVNVSSLKKSLYYEKERLLEIRDILLNYFRTWNIPLEGVKWRLYHLFDLSVNFIIFSGIMIRWHINGAPILFYSYRSDYSYFPEKNTIILPKNETIITLKKFLSSLLIFTNKNIYYLVYNDSTPEGVAGGYFIRRILNAGIGAKSIKSVINYSNFIYFVATDNRVYRLYNIYSANEKANTNLKKIDEKVQPNLYNDIKKDYNPFLIEFKNILYLFVNGVCWKYYPENNDKKGAWTIDTSNLYKDFVNAFVEDNKFYLATKKGFYVFDENTFYDNNENIDMKIITKSHTLGYPSNLKKFKRVYLNFNSFVNINEDFKIYTRIKKNNQTVYQEEGQWDWEYNFDKDKSFVPKQAYWEKPKILTPTQNYSTSSNIIPDVFKTPLYKKQYRMSFNNKGYNIQYSFLYRGGMPIILENYAFEYRLKKVK